MQLYPPVSVEPALQVTRRMEMLMESDDFAAEQTRADFRNTFAFRQSGIHFVHHLSEDDYVPCLHSDGGKKEDCTGDIAHLLYGGATRD